MLTREKILLLVPRNMLCELTYEALEVVETLEDVPEVWKRNKTPMMEQEIYEKHKPCDFPVIYVPTYNHGTEFFTAWCHKSGFEPGEFMTGSKYNTFKDVCFLCNIGSHRIQNNVVSCEHFNTNTDAYYEMIIMETTNFFVKLELGSIIKGMLMINPKEHFFSMASLPEDLYEEYESLKVDVENVLKETYGNEIVIFFEHGSAPDGISSHQRSIVHAHTHVTWGVQFPEKYLKMVQLREIGNIQELKGFKYMSYQEGAKGKLLAVWDPKVYVQRQYPRQVIAELSGIPNYLSNWRVEPFEENMKQTLRDLYSVFTQKQLPERILKEANAFIKAFPERKDI